MSDRSLLDEYATDFRALDLLESMWIPAPARDGKDYRMGETPKQHDIASHERSSEHDQLNVAPSTSGDQPRAPSRNTLSDSRVADEKFVDLLRAAAVLIVFFQLVYAAEHRYTSPSTFDATLGLHLVNIAIGVMSFLLSFTRAMPRCWRQIAVFVCGVLLVSTTAICADSMRIEPLFVSALVIVVGGGTLVPWDWGWQAAISTVGMVCFYLLDRAHGIVDSDPSMHWLGLITAVGLAQSNVSLQTKNRRAIAQNLADRLSSGQKFTDSEQKFRQIFEQSGDIVVVTNLDTDAILEVNNQFVVRTRVPRELVVGRKDSDFNFFTEPAARERFMKELHHSGVVKNLEVKLTGLGYDRPMPALISAVAVRLNNENCAIIVVREISDVREAERKLRNSEANLRKIFDSILDPVSITDLEGRFVDVNDEFMRLSEYSRAEIIGQVSDNETAAAYTESLRTNRQVRNFEVTIKAKSGVQIPVLLSSVVVELGGEERVVTIARDITDLEAARQKALAASKAKTEFLSSMSHEIRTPMNAILGMADLIGESDLNSEQRRYLGTILSNGNALLELINSILDLARVESGRMNLEAVAFDVVELTEKVADTLAVRAHEKGIELAVRFSGDLPPTLVGDSLRLRQVLTNLIGNAIKFTERGEIVVDVAHNPDQSNPGNLLFSVRDSGIGMPRDTLSNIFSAFTQADSSTTRKYGGSGLGLAIVERLVVLMGGRVWAESELGAGSTFHFTVELEVPPAVASESKTQQHRGIDLCSVRVLVVDDNATNRSIVRQMLRTAGAVVTEAVSGAEGLAAFAAANRNGAPFGLLLVDLQMPVMDGFEMIRRMRRGANGNAPIVMLVTSSGLTSRLNAMRELGLNYYVVKPVKSRELYAAISDAMAEVVAPANAAVEPRHEVAANGSGTHLLDRPLDILLADDSPDNRLLIAAYLKKSGYVLDEVEDGQAALDRFMTRAYDVVLMDIQMPVLDGYSAVRKIREWETANERGRTPIIALSASALETDVRHAIQVGCDLHVSKPVKKSTLLKAIAGVVENSGHDDAAAKPSSSGGRDSTSVQE
jgi:PAS domain S-box-containing protein